MLGVTEIPKLLMDDEFMPKVVHEITSDPSLCLAVEIASSVALNEEKSKPSRITSAILNCLVGWPVLLLNGSRGSSSKESKTFCRRCTGALWDIF